MESTHLSPAQNGAENTAQIGNGRPMTVPRTGVYATIIDRKHGAQDEESLDEAEDLGLPVLTGVTTPQSRLKPVWIFHGFLVDGVNPRGEFFLDDLAVVVVPAANT